jgi:amino acid transporter
MSLSLNQANPHSNNDIEMASQEVNSERPSAIDTDLKRGGRFRRSYERAIGSFDRHPKSFEEDARLKWLLEKNLNGYHSQLIALGSAIGTGLFLASGEGLANAGPIPLLGAFSFVGLTFSFTVFGLGEMATCFPLPGGFFKHCTMFIDEAWGGAMGWKYAFVWHTIINR